MANGAASAGFPPWGQMDKDLLAEMVTHPLANDWEAGNTLPARQRSWDQWFAQVTNAIDVLIWPKYVPGQPNWGSAAVQELTGVDLELMADLRIRMEAPIDLSSGTTVTHGELFLEEDRPPWPGFGYGRYDPQLTAGQISKFHTDLLTDMGNKVGTISLQLKQLFQRPRAYQVALMQGITSFQHREAYSASTPSLVSGHCLQGSMGGCGAYARLASVLNAKSVEILEQFTVDIGDRRVFAGVHYPSDNLSSWFTALSLVPHVFAANIAANVSAFLWRAISSRSIVYAAVREHVSSNSRSPYLAAVQEIEAMGSRI